MPVIKKSCEQALKFLQVSHQYGFQVEIRGNVVSIKKSFTPGDLEAFTRCDSDYDFVLSYVPLTGGSIWGTDGGSIGGHVAIKTGQFVMNMSGNGKRFLEALNTLLVLKLNPNEVKICS